MTCEDMREKLAACFDAGDVPDASIQRHVDTCSACAAFQAQLEGLDDLLRHPTPVEDDFALVARIQAAVANARPVRMPLWMRVAIGLAVVAASIAGGWVIDVYSVVPEMTASRWLPSEGLLPDWSLLGAELQALPAELQLETAEVAATFSGILAEAGTWLTSLVNTNSLLLWGACIAGLVLVIMVDTREARRTA